MKTTDPNKLNAVVVQPPGRNPVSPSLPMIITPPSRRFARRLFPSARALLTVSVLAALAVSSQSFAATPASVKYSDNGIKPGTGRSGSASLQVRALIAKDGSTQVQATTGDLDAGTSPGNIDKVQAKLFGSKLTTLNYNGLKAGGF